jgi:O-antigen/teichoic acid export membrane protein
MAMLATGSGIARIIGMVTVPIITRIYSPEHFGVLSIFTVLIAMLTPFSTLRYATAIPLTKRDSTAVNMVGLCTIFLAISTLLLFLLFWITAPAILRALSMEQMLPYWWLVPLAVTGAGLYELLGNWATREKAFRVLAKTQVWQVLLGGSVKIGLGLLGIKPLGLLLGQLFTEAGGILSLLRSFRANLYHNWQYVGKKRVLFLLKRFSDFPRYRLPSQFVLILSSRAPLLFFSWQYGAATTGQLALSLSMIALPMSLFGQTIGQAYYAEIAKIGRKNPKQIYAITKNITKKLFLISLLPFALLVLLGPWLFQLVFGHPWREAGGFSSILAIFLLTQFISTPLVNAMNVFERQKMFLTINLVRLVLILLIFGIGHALLLPASMMLLVYSLGLSAHYLFTAFMVFGVIKSSGTVIKSPT